MEYNTAAFLLNGPYARCPRNLQLPGIRVKAGSYPPGEDLVRVSRSGWATKDVHCIAGIDWSGAGGGGARTAGSTGQPTGSWI